jgi:predicted  nucleic acid-binding Zn-ribbon protein
MKNIHTTPDSKLFSLDNSNPNKDWVNREELNNNAKIEGAREAARANCDISVLKMWFNKIYQQIREGIQNQSESQKRQKDKLEEKIVGLSRHNEKLDNEIDGLKVNISDKEQSIEGLKVEEEKKHVKFQSEISSLKEEIDRIRSGDKSFIDDESRESDKLGFWLGVTILVFLTLYLFIFYISVIYSAFIFDVNEWVENNLQNKEILTNTIVNLKAIPETFSKNGFLGVIFLFSAAFLFIGLGYLIHKFDQAKAKLKTISIYTFTFLFDALLAYSIVRDIHVAKFKSGEVFTEWNFFIAFSDTNFYIILMAGFSIYIIWGIILGYVLKEYDNLAPAKVAIRKRKINLKITKENIKKSEERFDKMKVEVKGEIDVIKNEIKTVGGKIENNKTAIETSKKEIENINRTIEIPVAEVKRIITEFTVGWTNQINLIFPNDDAQGKVLECKDAKESFFKSISNPN